MDTNIAIKSEKRKSRRGFYRATVARSISSMSPMYWRKALSVVIRSWTVVQAWRTVAWSLPPSSAPMVDREQFAMRLRHSYMAIWRAWTMGRFRLLESMSSRVMLK